MSLSRVEGIDGNTKPLANEENNSKATISSSSSISSSSQVETKQERSILVLINPHSGRGKSIHIYRKKLLPILNTNGIEHEVFITESNSRVHELLLNKSLIELINLKSIVVVSGDGLFYETVNALMTRKDFEQAMTVPLGIIPAGSGNGLAYTLLRQTFLDLKTRDEAIKLCCDQVAKDETCQADLVKITYGASKTIWSFLSLGWGLLSDIDIDSEWLRGFGEFRFTIYGLLRSITSVSYRGRLSFKVAKSSTVDSQYQLKPDKEQATNLIKDSSAPGKTDSTTEEQTKNSNELAGTLDDWVHIEDKFSCLYAVYLANISSVTKFSPKSTLTDQLIYLTYVRGKLNPCQTLKFLLSINDGSHEQLPYVTVVPVRSFRFQPLEQSKIVVDGEVIPWSLSDGPISAEVVPKMLKLAWDINKKE